jgi:hypothetical protein
MSLDNDYLYKEYANLVKQGEGFNHAINIERGTGSIDDIIAWCKTNFADALANHTLKQCNYPRQLYIFFQQQCRLYGICVKIWLTFLSFSAILYIQLEKGE